MINCKLFSPCTLACCFHVYCQTNPKSVINTLRILYTCAMVQVCVSRQACDRPLVAVTLPDAKPLPQSMWEGSRVARLQSLTSFA